MKLYTIREAAEALGTNKTAIRRLMKQIPPEELSAGTYRGQPTILISQKGFDMLVSLQGERQAEQEAQQEAQPSDSSAPELVAELRARIAAQDREIMEKNEQINRLTVALDKAMEATQAAQALHAATAEQLKLLTAARTAQDEPEPKEGNDTTQEEERAQEAASEPPEPEITRRPTLADRLRFLFKGEM